MSIHSPEQVALLTDYDTDSAYSEAYRTLYSNIRFSWDSEKSKLQTLLITTPSAYTACATAAANVAIAAAQSGTSTLLIDANLRAPSLEQRFGLARNAGLHDLLVEKTTTPQKVDQYLSQTFIPGLRLLSAGTGIANEGATMLLSVKLQEVVDNIRQYLTETEAVPSLIVFNTAPVLVGPDASLIGALTEQTILTIAKGHTTRAQAKQAQEQLQRAHANLAGIVILDI